MTDEAVPTREERTRAAQALLPVLAGLIETVADCVASDSVVEDAGRLAQSLRDAAVVAEALQIVATGARR